MSDSILVRFWAVHKEDGIGEVEENVPRKQFIEELLKWICIQMEKGIRIYDSQTSPGKDGNDFDNIFHWRLIPDFKLEDYKSISVNDEEPPDTIYPKIKARMGETWAYITVKVPMIYGKEQPPIQMFAFKQADGDLREVQLPEGLHIEGDHPNLRGDEVLYPVGKFPWPLPVVEPKRYEELGKLYLAIEAAASSLQQVIEPEETNPLRIIRKSPQPYRGLGEQLRQQIEKRIEQLDGLLNTPYSEFWSLD